MIDKLSLGLTFLFIMNSIHATEVCFSAKEGTTILIQEGDCDIRYSPCSTFKIPLAIIGYQENILIDESFPEWPYLEKEYQASRTVCQKSQNPTTWIQNSCLWYSQIITQKVGMEKLYSYLDLFNYGNKDLSGEAGKNNGLTRAWLNNSLKISVNEQIQFIQKFINAEFPLSLEALEKAKNLFYIKTMNGWQLYGKTGSDCQINADGSHNEKRGIGWFVGWLIKDDKQIVFAQYIEDDKDETLWVRSRAKEITLSKLTKLIEDLKESN